ncbi:MAG: hypothetical protein KA248_11155 [Kiritimatiellae bacterium]|nr:hypothetical protein [Kiritimatiellia bacterium]
MRRGRGEWAWCLAGAGLLLAAAGCQAPPASAVGAVAEQRLATIRVAGRSHDVLEGPAYPMPLTRHILRWKGGLFEWDILFRDREDSYATILLRRPLDLRRYRPKSYLRLRIIPDAAAEALYIGLASEGPGGAPAVMAQLPLAPYRTWRRNALGYYAIPLKDFGARGRALSGDARRTPTGAEGPLNWDRIAEVRVGLLSLPAPGKAFVISRLEIGASPRVSEK